MALTAQASAAAISTGRIDGVVWFYPHLTLGGDRDLYSPAWPVSSELHCTTQAGTRIQQKEIHLLESLENTVTHAALLRLCVECAAQLVETTMDGISSRQDSKTGVDLEKQTTSSREDYQPVVKKSGARV